LRESGMIGAVNGDRININTAKIEGLRLRLVR
jgi:hypothetical protein